MLATIVGYDLHTLQLKAYASWLSSNPRIDDSYVAVAANSSTLVSRIYTDPIFQACIPTLLYCFQFIFPLCVVLLALLCTCCFFDESLEEYIDQIEQKNGQATIAAYVVICSTFVSYVLAMDIAALCVRDNCAPSLKLPTSEFFPDSHPLYYYPGMLYFWDVPAFLCLVIAIVLCLIKCCTKYCFLITFGFAALVCFASHAHYIAIAFITDTVYASSVGIYYGITVFVHFILLKHAYKEEKVRCICRMTFTWLVIVVFQVVLAVFVVIIPIKHSIEKIPAKVYTFLQGVGTLLVALIAYKVIHDPRQAPHPPLT